MSEVDSILPLAAQDLPAAVELLALAFRDNPLNRAVLRGRSAAARLRANRHGMRAQLPVARRHGQVLGARAEGALAGVLLATPPYGYPLPAPPLGARLRCWLGQGPRVVARWGRVWSVLDARHPEEPHWYLGTLGVAPEQQGRGIGSALLAHWLAELDRAGGAAYLETDRECNLGFYERAGFVRVAELGILGVRVWTLRRAGRTLRRAGRTLRRAGRTLRREGRPSQPEGRPSRREGRTGAGPALQGEGEAGAR